MKQLISCRRTVFIGRVQLSNKTLFTNECKMQTRQKSESLLFQYHTARTNKRRLSSTYAVTSKTANMRQIMFVCVRSYCYLLPWFSENTWRSKVTLNPLHNLLSSWKQWKWVDQARRKRQRYRIGCHRKVSALFFFIVSVYLELEFIWLISKISSHFTRSWK